LIKKGQDKVMDTISAIKTRILRLCAERNITINKLATMSALPPSSIKNILYGKSTDPKISTIKKMCDGLDMTLIDFFNSPEFEDLEPEIK
jgi:transcriptional regulator with XRE-family HTH domain